MTLSLQFEASRRRASEADGADYFLLIGNEIGCFGVEGIHEQSIPEPRFAEIVEKTKVRLKEAGITEPPAFYVQLQAQY